MMFKFINKLSLVFTISLTLFFSASSFASNVTSVANNDWQKQLDRFHSNTKSNGEALKVVYFYPKDTQPYPQYRQRLTRILQDVQKYYAEQLASYGITNNRLPLEMEDSLLKLYVLEGQFEASDYYRGKKASSIREEIKRQLEDHINFSKSFVLVITAQCEVTPSGAIRNRSSFFGVPQYAPQHGISFAADCYDFDTDYTNENEYESRLRRDGSIFDITRGESNRKRAGAIAHELAHGLGAHHDRAFATNQGASLMSQEGAASYRQELAGLPKSYLTETTALLLATNPLFTQSNHKRNKHYVPQLLDLKVAYEQANMIISGKLEDGNAPLAVNVYLNPDDLASDHDAISWIAPVHDGQFQVKIQHSKFGNYKLRMNTLYSNGLSKRLFHWEYPASPSINPTTRQLIQTLVAGTLYQSGQKSKAQEAIQGIGHKPRTPKVREQLSQLKILLEEKPTVDIAKLDTNQIYLSDVSWSQAKVGQNKPVRNLYPPKPARNEGATTLQLLDTKYAKGLYAHSPSSYQFDIGGNWQTFSATVGLQKGARKFGSGVFVVKGDGKELYRSSKLNVNHTESIEVDISGVKQLELLVVSGKNNNQGCWTIWADPMIHKKQVH